MTPVLNFSVLPGRKSQIMEATHDRLSHDMRAQGHNNAKSGAAQVAVLFDVRAAPMRFAQLCLDEARGRTALRAAV